MRRFVPACALAIPTILVILPSTAALPLFGGH